MINERLLKRTTWLAGAVLIALTVLVVLPLTIKILTEGGGMWGFNVIGLPELLPLCAYLLFGIAGMLPSRDHQRNIFIAAHCLTIIVGVTSLFFIPVYPFKLALIPLMLAVVGIFSRSKFKYFLVLMILLGILANGLLLKWELDFHRSLPIVELFRSQQSIEP